MKFFVQPVCFNRIIIARCIPAAFVKLSWISNRLHAAFMSTELMNTQNDYTLYQIGIPKISFSVRFLTQQEVIW